MGNSNYDVIVLGAGAAGLMCAITAAGRGKRVLVLEVSNRAGKKILMSGGGRCNFTNLYISAEDYLCLNPHFVKSALTQYTQWDFIQEVEAAGIKYHEKTQGQLFCDHSSKDILNLLLNKCRSLAVTLLLEAETLSVNDDYKVKTSKGEFSAASLVIATGGLSIPTLGGATGLGYRLAQQFNLGVSERSAGLVPFTLTGKWQTLSAALSGVSLLVKASIPRYELEDELLFTHRGLSGPVMLQLSNYWELGDEIELDLLPDVNLSQFLIESKVKNPNSSLSKVLKSLLPNSLVDVWLENVIELGGHVRRFEGGRVSVALQNFSNLELKEISQTFKSWRIKPSGTEGYRTAEVTRGGVSVDEISSKTMEVKKKSGLYFIGEVLDVTGRLGGYNFQWAWSSGYVAGLNV